MQRLPLHIRLVTHTKHWPVYLAVVLSTPSKLTTLTLCLPFWDSPNALPLSTLLQVTVQSVDFGYTTVALETKLSHVFSSPHYLQSDDDMSLVIKQNGPHGSKSK